MLCFSVVAFAQSAADKDEVFSQANQLYEAGNYEQAIASYQSIIETTGPTANLYYNLGDAYYRMGEIGKSLVYFERAYRMNPADRDTRENLDFVYSKTEDHIEEIPQFMLVRWWNSLVQILSLRGWKIVFVLVLSLFWISFVIFRLSRDYMFRKVSFISTLSILAIFIFVIGLTISSYSLSKSHNQAIVTAPMTVVKGSPDGGSVDKFILHEGTKVKISDEVDSWYKISIADGSKGWMPIQDVTII